MKGMGLPMNINNLHKRQTMKNLSYPHLAYNNLLPFQDQAAIFANDMQPENRIHKKSKFQPAYRFGHNGLSNRYPYSANRFENNMLDSKFPYPINNFAFQNQPNERSGLISVNRRQNDYERALFENQNPYNTRQRVSGHDLQNENHPHVRSRGETMLIERPQSISTNHEKDTESDLGFQRDFDGNIQSNRGAKDIRDKEQGELDGEQENQRDKDYPLVQYANGNGNEL